MQDIVRIQTHFSGSVGFVCSLDNVLVAQVVGREAWRIGKDLFRLVLHRRRDPRTLLDLGV